MRILSKILTDMTIWMKLRQSNHTSDSNNCGVNVLLKNQSSSEMYFHVPFAVKKKPHAFGNELESFFHCGRLSFLNHSTCDLQTKFPNKIEGHSCHGYHQTSTTISHLFVLSALANFMKSPPATILDRILHVLMHLMKQINLY